MMRLLLSVLLLWASVMAAQAAVVYKYTDKKGTIVYTNKRPRGVAVKQIFVFCPACDPESKVDWTKTGLNLSSYSEEVQREASRHSIEPSLVRAIMHAESAFNPSALSKAGAQGLMQLMPGTANQYGCNDSFDPAQNIKGGVAYLRFLMDMFDGNADLAMAAYNAGENAVLKYAGVPPYAETQVYVERVGILHRRYREELSKNAVTTAAR